VNKQIIDEAAAWLVEFNTGDADPGRKIDFDRWLRQSPEHVRAYLELLAIWSDGALALPGDKTTPRELIDTARAAEDSVSLKSAWGPDRHRIAPEDSTTTVGSATGSAAGRRKTALSSPMTLAASILAFIAGGVVIALWAANSGNAYSTAVGERRAITLSDGSSVELNTNSRIRVRFTEETRGIELLSGQALFRVAKNAYRPFVVRSGSVQVQAVGTEFEVYRKPIGTVVTVLEGRVKVGKLDVAVADSATAQAVYESQSPAAGGMREMMLVAGEQATAGGRQVIQTPVKANVTALTAWTQGRLIFESATLDDVAAEFNRYNERRILVDEGAKGFLINGSFLSTNPDSLLIFLRTQPGIVVRETPAAIYIDKR